MNQFTAMNLKISIRNQRTKIFYRNGLSIICAALHQLIEKCVLVLEPCYTIKEADAIKQRQTKLMNLAMQILIPEFDYLTSCNHSMVVESFHDSTTSTPLTSTSTRRGTFKETV